MFDSLKNLSQMPAMMAKAREMQQKMAEVQQRLPSLRATCTSEGGHVTVVADGLLQIVSLEIQENALLQGPARLSQLTRDTVNEALRTVQQQIQQEMQEASGGLDMGAFKNLLGGGGAS